MRFSLVILATVATLAAAAPVPEVNALPAPAEFGVAGTDAAADAWDINTALGTNVEAEEGRIKDAISTRVKEITRAAKGQAAKFWEKNKGAIKSKAASLLSQAAAKVSESLAKTAAGGAVAAGAAAEVAADAAQAAEAPAAPAAEAAA
ncbi:hypothetical protein HGRIS_003342 [Hohenbuehelia grisea]|uniref:Uncharacterized protein n=1 Tax=Hohenbuehelia grisea TaxID=104357 RepID=A0ABR3JF25_9AGAR